MSLLSEDVYVENIYPCTSLHNIDVYTNKCLIINFVGPFSDGGYILVIVCTVTRWIVLYHTLDATALSATECLLKHFGRSGTPYHLRSDNSVNER